MIKTLISNVMTEHFGSTNAAITFQILHGGSINEVFKVTDSSTKLCFLVKANQSPTANAMFEAEADGLARLHAAKAFRVPAVYGVYRAGDWHFLFMEYIKPHPNAASGAKFAQALYHLHQHTHSHFGLEQDNFIGSLHQSNKQHVSWADFFVEERLRPLLQRAITQGYLNENVDAITALAKHRTVDLFPPHPPACLHGDLWSGNAFTDNMLNPVVFDPAVYYGHPFMDLGMMKLFGGFDKGVFQAYADYAGYEPGWEEGLELANLYPLLVHVNLFGAPYVQQAGHIIKRFLN